MGDVRVESGDPTSSRGAAGWSDDAELRALARARPDLAWPEGVDISKARNAHEANTRGELKHALQNEFDFLEVDVRVDDNGVAVLRHDPDAKVELTLEQFLSIVGPSGRGVKFDIKERAALPQVLELAHRSGIPEHRLLFNVGNWAPQQLRSIRYNFPTSWVNISPTSDNKLTSADLVRMQVSARIVGGPVMFPIRQEMASPGVVHALHPYGRIAIWNIPGVTNPREDDVRRLREMGVDGMIDLREPSGWEHASTAAIRVAANIFGWQPVEDLLDAVGVFD
jgi:glycerophosphoryl diester phosphodiesterase